VALAREDLKPIPVLVGGAQMPTEDELPPSLASLARMQAMTLRHDGFDEDLPVLFRVLDGQAARVQAPRVWNLRSPALTFLAREDEIARLDEGFAAAPAGRRIVAQALCGLGGVGKTQLALAYAERYGGGYDLGWWISAADASTIRTGLAQLAGKLQIAAGDDSQERQAKDALDALSGGGRFLLVFDGAADPKDVENWLPREGRAGDHHGPSGALSGA
jgi:hypothetical protein